MTNVDWVADAGRDALALTRCYLRDQGMGDNDADVILDALSMEQLKAVAWNLAGDVACLLREHEDVEHYLALTQAVLNRTG